MNQYKREKIAYIHVSPETHAALKALAIHNRISLQGTAAHWLNQLQPVMQEMLEAINEIKSGQNKNKVLEKVFAKQLHLAVHCKADIAIKEIM